MRFFTIFHNIMPTDFLTIIDGMQDIYGGASGALLFLVIWGSINTIRKYNHYYIFFG